MPGQSDTLDAFLSFGEGRAKSTSIKIEGESPDLYEAAERGKRNHFGSSQLIRYELGFSLDTAPGTETDNKSGDTATHAPELKAVQVTKAVDAASPKIMQAMTMATKFSDVWIVQRKSGGSQTKSGEYFWKINLQNVHISDLNWSADADNLTETLSLTYQMIKVQYYKQKTSGDLESGAIEGAYPREGDKLSVVKTKNSSDLNADQIEKNIFKKLKALNNNIRIPP